MHLLIFEVLERHEIPGGSNCRAIKAVAGAVIITLE